MSWLAARIADHLQELDLEPGAHITEQALADRFKVSRVGSPGTELEFAL